MYRALALLSTFLSYLPAATQPQQQQNVQNPSAQLANMVTAVIRPQIYGDERDTIIAKWNQLQAFWGAGKGFYNQQGHCVEFKQDNPFCRFKVTLEPWHLILI